MREAMIRMDELLGPAERQVVREKCACCLGGWRRQAAKTIARDFQELDERIEAFDKSGIGGRVKHLRDGRISSTFLEGPGPYRCPCMPKAEQPMPVTYCQCCGGHLKHHMQIALGRRLSVDVRSSVLSSGGKHPCVFFLTVEE